MYSSVNEKEGIHLMKDLITKDDLIQLGYPKYTLIRIIRQADSRM
ncbi:DUF3173 family protein [Oceanobacillus sojae]